MLVDEIEKLNQLIDDESVISKLEIIEERMKEISKTLSEQPFIELNQPNYQDLFKRIDQIQNFINIVTRNVDELDNALKATEKHYQPSIMEKVFGSTGIPVMAHESGQIPEIFKTNDYFKHPYDSLINNE